MSVFTPAHLGKWEPLYRRLLEGETLPLTEEGTWMLGRKTGVIAVLHESEPIFIEATKDVGQDGVGVPDWGCQLRFSRPACHR